MYEKIVYVSVSLSSGGGISSLMKHYKNILPVFHHISSVSERVAKPLKYAYVFSSLIQLLIYRIFYRCETAHFHGASYSSYKRKYLLAKWAKIIGYKTIYHLHAGDFLRFHQETGTPYLEYTLKHYDAIAVLSEYWKEYIENNFRCKNVYIVNNIVSKPQVTQPKKIEDNSLFQLLYMGALYKDKGAYDLLNFANKYRNKFQRKLIINICGGKTNKEINEFKQALDTISDDGLIQFHGWVEADQKIHLLQTADALILPSYYEGLPMCILEAMSYSKPVLATPVGSIPELIKSGETGYLFEPGNIDQMALKISTFLQNRGKAKAMGENGRNIATQYFPENVKAQLDSLYSKI